MEKTTVWKMGSQLSVKIQKRVSLIKNLDGFLCVLDFSLTIWSALEEFLAWMKISFARSISPFWPFIKFKQFCDSKYVNTSYTFTYSFGPVLR